MDRKISIVYRSIKSKLIISVSLMSVIPILICLNYVFPNSLISNIAQSDWQVLIIVVMVILSGLGFMIVRQIVYPVANISRDAKLIAGGDLQRHIDVKTEDEVGQLGVALNQLTNRIKENLREVSIYSSRASEINLEINRRMLILSSLLQVSNLIVQGIRLEEILHLCVEKASAVADSSACFLLLLEGGKFKLQTHSGIDNKRLEEINLSEHDEFLISMFQKHTPFLLDAKNHNKLYEKFVAMLGIRNCLCITLFLTRKPIAILGIGNSREDFGYKADDIGLLDIFAKQITIGLENDLLSRKLEKLEIRDTLTGLYNEQYIFNRLDEEIKRAIIYQRPCSLVLVKTDNFRNYQANHGLIASELLIKKIASCLNTAISEVDRLGRVGDFEFAIVMPEKNKRQTKNFSADIQKKIAYIFRDEPDANKKVTVSVSIAENPLDGTSAKELVSYARNQFGNSN